MSMRCDVDAMDRLLGRLQNLQSSPTVARQILTLTRTPDFEMREVVACLQHDPTMAAKILRVVNSSRYGLAHHVSSVRHAAAILGQRTLRMFAVTFALVESLMQGPMTDFYADYCLRALTMASGAARLAEKSPETSSDEAYTSGLLADVGALVLAQLENRRYQHVYESALPGSELICEEQNTFGFNHAQLGARLLSQWELPESVVEAVGHHHTESSEPQPLRDTVFAGNLLADLLAGPDACKLQQATRFLCERFHTESGDLVELTADCMNEVNEGALLFGGVQHDLSKPDNVLARVQELIEAAEETVAS